MTKEEEVYLARHAHHRSWHPMARSADVPMDMPDDCEFVFFGGGAKPTDARLAVTIHCVDDQVIDAEATHRFNRSVLSLHPFLSDLHQFIVRQLP